MSDVELASAADPGTTWAEVGQGWGIGGKGQGEGMAEGILSPAESPLL